LENLTFISLFIIGLSYGATACMFSCMPFLAPLFVNNSNSFYHSSKVVLPFSLGRVFTYTLIAIIASISSVIIKSTLNDNSLFQNLLGCFTIVMGFLMLIKVFKNKKACNSSNKTNIFNKKGVIGLFTIGALVSLNPCAPILTLVTISANTSSIPAAVLFGLSFGFGAILVPFIFYTFVVSNIFRGLLEQFKSSIRYIELFASFFLIFVGLMVLLGEVTL